jgi:hypothetical protein
MLYMILHYLNFLKDVLILTSYALLDALTLNHDHKIDIIYFI